MLIPRLSAALVLLPLASFRVWIISSFSMACIVPRNWVGEEVDFLLWISSSSKNRWEGSRIPSSHIRVARSIMFSSSRTLPGQPYFFQVHINKLGHNLQL